MNHVPHALDREGFQRATLLRMTRQIATAFAALPDGEAAAEIAKHINQFWSRALRRDLAALVGPDAPDLPPTVRDAWEAIHFPVP